MLNAYLRVKVTLSGIRISGAPLEPDTNSSDKPVLHQVTRKQSDRAALH
jgi:hypothetical protein